MGRSDSAWAAGHAPSDDNRSASPSCPNRSSRPSLIGEEAGLAAAFGLRRLGRRLAPLLLLVEPPLDEGAHEGAHGDAAAQALTPQPEVVAVSQPHRYHPS